MVPKMLKLRCAGYGPDYTAADNLKAAAVTIGGTLALALALMWAMARYGKIPISNRSSCLVARAVPLQPTLHGLEGTPGPRAGSAHRRPGGDRDCNRFGGRLAGQQFAC